MDRHSEVQYRWLTKDNNQMLIDVHCRSLHFVFVNGPEDPDQVFTSGDKKFEV